MFGGETKRHRSRYVAWVTLTALLVGVPGGTPAEDALEIVIPKSAECNEGNSFSNPAACAQVPSPLRIQGLAAASEFEDLRGREPMQITELRFRPDARVDSPGDVTYFGMEVYLAVTDSEPCFEGGDCMSTRSFDDNRAPGEGTLVFEGDWSASTQNVPGCGTAKAFDYVLALEEPFPYDPDDGNILLDFAYQSCTGSASFDIEDEDPAAATVVGIWCQDWDVTSPGVCTGEGEEERGALHASRAIQFRFEPIEPIEPPPEELFIRGDCNGDGEVKGQVTDAVFLLNYLFLGGEAPPCQAACDPNGDGVVDLSDAVYLLAFNFLGGPPPVAPYPDCGPGELPTDADLGCEEPPAACAEP